MVDRKAAGYVRSCMDAGWPVSRIKSDLYNAGWSKKDVEEAISSAKASEPSQAAAPAPETPRFPGEGKPSSKLMLYVGILIIIAAVGLGTYYFVSTYLLSQSPPPTTNIVMCGDGICSAEESYELCPADCSPAAACGDGICNGQETYEICLQDCSAPPVNPVNQDVSVSIKDAGKTFNSGESVTYQVEITGVSNLFGFQFDFEYDATALSYQSWSEGSFLNRNGQDQTLCIPPTGSAGAVRNAACTRTGSQGIEGMGNLASFTFTALRSGTGGVRLANAQLVDSSTPPKGISVQIV